MKLFIFDRGDVSVGIFMGEYCIECPFEEDEVSAEELDFFRKTILELYIEHTQGRTTAMYDYEIEDETNSFGGE